MPTFIVKRKNQDAPSPKSMDASSTSSLDKASTTSMYAASPSSLDTASTISLDAPSLPPAKVVASSTIGKGKQPRGRPPKGKIWVGGKWEDGVKSSEPKEKKPRGRPPKGKIWKNGEWVSNEKPKLTFKRMTIGGRTVFLRIKGKALEPKAVTKAPKTVGKAPKAVGKVPKTEGKAPREARTTVANAGSKTTQELLLLNKKLHKLLRSGKKSGASELINQGASFAYFNFEGICQAAEDGNMDIFYDIFDNTDFAGLIDVDLGNDLMESAEETGHTDLAELIGSYSEEFLEKIENQNLAGMNAFNE